MLLQTIYWVILQSLHYAQSAIAFVCDTVKNSYLFIIHWLNSTGFTTEKNTANHNIRCIFKHRTLTIQSQSMFNWNTAVTKPFLHAAHWFEIIATLAQALRYCGASGHPEKLSQFILQINQPSSQTRGNPAMTTVQGFLWNRREGSGNPAAEWKELHLHLGSMNDTKQWAVCNI